MLDWSQLPPPAKGFSLVEVIVAVVITSIGVAALAQLVAMAVRANADAKSASLAMLLARDKMEQLHAVLFVHAGASGETDLSSDLARWPFAPSGGRGLSWSPSDALVRNVAGFCDFADERGSRLGGGGLPPPRTAFVRRWAVEPYASAPQTAIVLHVRVLRWPDAADDPAAPASSSGDVRITTVKTRGGI